MDMDTKMEEKSPEQTTSATMSPDMANRGETGFEAFRRFEEAIATIQDETEKREKESNDANPPPSNDPSIANGIDPNPTNDTKTPTMDKQKKFTQHLSGLISTFRIESENQGTLLSVIEKGARNDPNFASPSNANQWTPQEVCYWLVKIGFGDYIGAVYSLSIDGARLLSPDFCSDGVLSDELHITEASHRTKLSDAIQQLLSELPQPLATVESGRSSGMVIITPPLDEASLQQKSTEELIAIIQDLKHENTKISQRMSTEASSSTYDLDRLNSLLTKYEHDIKVEKSLLPQSPRVATSAAEDDDDDDDDDDNDTGAASASASDESSDGGSSEVQMAAEKLRMVEDMRVRISELEKDVAGKEKSNKSLQKGIRTIRSQYQSQLDNHKKKIRELENSYVTLETHYETQMQKKESQKQIQFTNNHKSNPTQSENSNLEAQLSMLWSENEQLTNECEDGKANQRMLESKVTQLRLQLIGEKQRRQLLENQTTRLTQELTHYLVDATFTTDADDDGLIDESRERSPSLSTRVKTLFDHTHAAPAFNLSLSNHPNTSNQSQHSVSSHSSVNRAGKAVSGLMRRMSEIRFKKS